MSAPAAGVTVDLAQLIDTRRRSAGNARSAGDLARAALFGENRSNRRGPGIAFEEVRPYQPGDDVRAIDWRVSARTGTTHSKVFTSEREQPVYLVLDQRLTMFFGSGTLFKSVFAAQLASALAWHTLSRGERLGAQIATETGTLSLPARRGRPAVVRFLNFVCEANQALVNQRPRATHQPVTISDLMQCCQRITRPGCVVYLLSDFIDFNQQSVQVLKQLGQGRHLNLVRILDPLEADFQVSGKLGISDSHGQQQATIRAQKAFRQRLIDKQQAQTTLLSQATRQSGARLIESQSQEPLDQIVQRCLSGPVR